MKLCDVSSDASPSAPISDVDIDQALPEITATEPQTDDIRCVSFRKTLGAESLVEYIHPHATTVIDIEMLRIPSGNVFATFNH